MARNLSRKQLVSSEVRSRGVHPVEADPGADGLQMLEYIS
jgi:hypothetical protein